MKSSNDTHSVKIMINHLIKLKSDHAPILSNIHNYDLLLDALNELDQLIEMDKVKQSIVDQLQFLLTSNLSLTSKSPKIDGKFEGHMLHTVIYGPPGVGKTKIGSILSKIWLALGLIDNTQISPIIPLLNNSTQTKYYPLAILNNLYEKVIDNLEKTYKNTISNLSSLNIKLNEQVSELKTLRNQLSTLTFPSQPQHDFILNSLDQLIFHQSSYCNLISKEISQYDSISSLIIHLTNDLSHQVITSSTNSSPIKIVSRADFVAEYLGQTSIKTLAVLKDNIGKVIFIDEAYSLVTSKRDSFGMEAITVLNQWMSEHSSDSIIIFAGYKDLLEKNIFSQQPGLRRRCTWTFEIEGYSPSGLAQIFISQLAEHGWSIDPNIDLVAFFERNKSSFPAFGGDTLKLAFYTKLAYSHLLFNSLLSSPSSLTSSKLITSSILSTAFDNFKSHLIPDSASSPPPPGIYI